MDRILVVNSTLADLYVLMLTKQFEGVEFKTATSSAEAVRRALEQTFDLAVLSHSLPDDDGPEAAKRLREAAPDMPIYGYSSLWNAQNAADAGLAGFSDQPLELFAYIRSQIGEV